MRGKTAAGMLTTQENVYLKITTKLGKDAIFLKSFRGGEGISDLFEFQLELFIPSGVNPDAHNLDFESIIETEATIEFTIAEKSRYINGVITHFSQGPTFPQSSGDGDKEEVTFFYATLRPKLWMLTLTENCRIFQKKDAITIIKEVLTDNEITIQDNTSTSGTEISDFCVQYNESDFNFISRLMEEEGIAYYFKHEDGLHTMVLSDGSTPFDPISDADFQTIEVSYYPDQDSGTNLSFYDVRFSQQVVPSKHTYKDFDMEKPSTDLKVESPGDGTLREYYRYPGRYITSDRGTSLSDMRMEELEWQKNSGSAKSDVNMVEVAHTFKLSGEIRGKPVRDDLTSKEFAIFSITHEGRLEDPNIKNNYHISPQMELNYHNSVHFWEKETPYRPARTARIPRIYGTQTATVSGKAGEEIWTDEYNRILVKFHWDISDTQDDEVSCWVRVAQSWADKNWGAFFTPRVGQEVVVTFLNGDPDQPLVTGCVYNANNMPPYGPDDATKNGFKTNSSKGGGGFNEFYFQDKKGEEDIYTQAQKDMTTDILDGQRTTIIHGTKQAGHDILTLKEGNQETTLTKGNRTTTLTKGDDTLDITGNQNIKISDDFMMDVGKNATIKVGKDCTIDVGGNLTITVAKSLSVKAMDGTYDFKTKLDVKAMEATHDIKTKLDIKALAATHDIKTKLDIKAMAMTTVMTPMAKVIAMQQLDVISKLTNIIGSGPITIKAPMVGITGAITNIKGVTGIVGVTLVKGPMMVLPA